MKASLLSIRNLHKNHYQAGNSIEILKGLDFNVPENETVSIVGPSGSGKTTLLSLLAGLDTPTSGEIIFSGSPIEKMSEEQLTSFRAQNIGIVFQQFHLMPHLSALENVMLPLEILGHDNIEKTAEKALADVGLNHRHTHLPSQLSGGECQRVAIARALVVQPKLLLADEPSGNLDQETGKEVMDLLFNLCREKNMTLILVTHDLGLAKLCNQQIQLSGGKIQ